MTIKMKSYIDSNGDIWQFPEDGSEDEFIPDGLELLDKKGLLAARKAQEAANAPTPEQVLAAALAHRDSLLASAGLRISPLQYAVDLKVATDAEAGALKDWKLYCIDVNRAQEQEGFPSGVVWPTPPS